MKDDRERCEHILEAIEQIEKYSVQGEEAFRKSDLIQNWMIRHIQIIGEALVGNYRYAPYSCARLF